MKSIIQELQKNALESSIKVSDLLRKALFVANKLELVEFEKWIKKELNGYCDEEELPEYRIFTGETKAWNRFNGYIPIIFNDPKDTEMFSKKWIRSSISEIETFSSNEDGVIYIKYHPRIEKLLMDNCDAERPPVLVISSTQIKALIEIVRNIILDWSLRLEKEGILGMDLSFTEDEKKTASLSSYNINNYFSNISNSQIQQDTISSKQKMNLSDLDNNNISKLIELIDKEFNKLELSENQLQEIKADIESVKLQMNSPNPKKNIIHECFRSIKTIIGKAAGNVAVNLLTNIDKLFPF